MVNHHNIVFGMEISRYHKSYRLYYNEITKYTNYITKELLYKGTVTYLQTCFTKRHKG